MLYLIRLVGINFSHRILTVCILWYEIVWQKINGSLLTAHTCVVSIRGNESVKMYWNFSYINSVEHMTKGTTLRNTRKLSGNYCYSLWMLRHFMINGFCKVVPCDYQKPVLCLGRMEDARFNLKYIANLFLKSVCNKIIYFRSHK